MSSENALRAGQGAWRADCLRVKARSHTSRPLVIPSSLVRVTCEVERLIALHGSPGRSELKIYRDSRV